MEELLREVQKIMLDCNANYTIFGGDLNTDISRNTPYPHSLVEFINENDLTFCTELDHADAPYTYMCELDNVAYTSKIDNFIVTSNLCEKIDNCLLLMNFILTMQLLKCPSLFLCLIQM